MGLTQSSLWFCKEIVRPSTCFQIWTQGHYYRRLIMCVPLEYTSRALRALAAVSDDTVSRSAIGVQLNVARSLKAKMPHLQKRRHLHLERPKHVLHESRAILRRFTGVTVNYSAICSCRALSAHALATEIGGPWGHTSRSDALFSFPRRTSCGPRPARLQPYQVKRLHGSVYVLSRFLSHSSFVHL